MIEPLPLSLQVRLLTHCSRSTHSRNMQASTSAAGSALRVHAKRTATSRAVSPLLAPCTCRCNSTATATPIPTSPRSDHGESSPSASSPGSALPASIQQLLQRKPASAYRFDRISPASQYVYPPNMAYDASNLRERRRTILMTNLSRTVIPDDIRRFAQTLRTGGQGITAGKDGTCCSASASLSLADRVPDV